MYVVRLEGGRLHSSWETYLDADNFVKYLNKTGQKILNIQSISKVPF
jgi:hypothetical protein